MPNSNSTHVCSYIPRSAFVIFEMVANLRLEAKEKQKRSIIVLVGIVLRRLVAKLERWYVTTV
ncbi:uncharacterized protein ASCRUDRAFT_73382 [Ascoidea rubescens DSM 1968]|uniref:Uncharacterized protein n=1 Tax=Ascoidea rubescens DSM 1968 TaxID=1344418 RepID=A0A1D2VPP6_9ASCO|nr:hypothetical protein ASCRUDRAFT_73382 [Ascoidea rubescens DSM 1968]ODV63554.1 hypothetical protein ASCRUDRAFT_73382 [Ascoidea rubescens DSM 1968]